MVGLRTRLAIERAGTETPHLQRGAPDFYPNNPNFDLNRRASPRPYRREGRLEAFPTPIDAKLAHACIRRDRSNATKTLRTGRHRRGASVQPVLLADADGAGAQGVVGGYHPLVLYRERRDRPAQFREGTGADRRRKLGRRFLGDRKLSGRPLSGPSLAVRRRGRLRYGADDQ